jgi:hypothetical protein
MKALNIQGIKSLLLLSTLIILIGFMGCSQESPLSSLDTPSEHVPLSLAKKPVNTARTLESSTSLVEESSTSGKDSYPQSASTTLRYWRKQKAYAQGSMLLLNGSQFAIPYASLTPPAGTPEGAEVTITFTVKKDEINNELIYEFGPSGCAFSPSAEVWMKWSDLLPEGNPKLFYIENDGSYVEQQPDQIDYLGQWMKININHFSRYAIAFSR